MICPVCLSPNCAQDGSGVPQGCGADLSTVPAEIRESADMRMCVLKPQLELLALVRRDLQRGEKRIVAAMLALEASQLTGFAPLPAVAAPQPIQLPVQPAPVAALKPVKPKE